MLILPGNGFNLSVLLKTIFGNSCSHLLKLQTNQRLSTIKTKHSYIFLYYTNKMCDGLSIGRTFGQLITLQLLFIVQEHQRGPFQF